LICRIAAREGRQFALQRRARFGTFSDVRMIILSLILSAGVPATRAQEQEAKLVERILRPNMSLVNSAQGKQFGAAGTLVAKKVPARNFRTWERSPAKSFATGNASSPGQFTTRRFVAQDETANISTRSQSSTDMVFVASTANSTRVAPENGRDLTMALAPFPGNRPFSGRGKSQKALSARDTPLTIEQVRELLNKSK
jgi:hypothetical protein